MAIILTSTAIVGFSVINFASNQAYQNTYQRLEGYASSLGELATEQGPDGLNNSSSNDLIDSHFLTKLQIVMQSDDLQIRVFNGKNKQLYPKMGPKVKLPKNIWNTLKSGNEVRIKNDHDQKETYFSSKDAYTSVIIPWFNGSKMVGAVWIGARVKNVEQPVNLAKRNLISAFVVTLIVSLILSYLISYYSLVKIKRLSKATKKVAAGDLNVQINHQDHDEIDDLASDFNSMVKALKKSAEAVKAQERRRDQFMADAAHEMRTPLTTINGILEGLEYDAIPEDSKPKSYQLMHRETNRLIRLVNENLDYEKIRNNQISLIKTNFDAAVPLNDLKTQLKTNAEKKMMLLSLRFQKSYQSMQIMIGLPTLWLT